MVSDSGIELLLCHSTDLLTGPHYNIRLNLIRGTWVTKVTPEIPENDHTTGELNAGMNQKRLETNRLNKLFDSDHPYGGFFVKIKVKPEYTGITFAKAGEDEDPLLAVKDNKGQGKKEGRFMGAR